MTAPSELRERFERAASDLSVGSGDVEEVVARGRARRRRQHLAAAAAAAAVIVLVVLAVPPPFREGRPTVIDPVSEAPSAPPTGSTAATEPPAVGLLLDHSRYGAEGVVRHAGSSTEPVRTTAAPVSRAIGLPEGGVVAQTDPAGPIFAVAPDGGTRELVPAGRWQRLLAVEDGIVWFTRRVDGGEPEGDVERLLSVAFAGDDAITDHGRSTGVESSTDALAFAPDGTVAWLGCHLQCTLFAGSVSELVSDGGRQLAPATWRSALAFAPDGSLLAVVEGPDPIVGGGTSEVVLLDPRDGAERARIDLGDALDLATVAVEFTPDGRSLVVGDDRKAFVVDLGGSAQARPLDGPGGVTLHVPREPT